MEESEPIVVGRYSSVSDAEMARMCLDSGGIDSFISNEYHSTLSPLSVIAFGGVGLMVDGEDAARARVLLAEDEAANRERYGVAARRCPACGSENVGMPGVPYLVFAVLMVVTVGLFSYFFRGKRRCRDCGAGW